MEARRHEFATASSLPPEAQAVLADLNKSNEARLALLEKRFSAVPPSPAASRGDTSLLQNSIHSCHSVRSSQKPPLPREQTPLASTSQLVDMAAGGVAAAAGARSRDGVEVGSEPPPTKRRRTQPAATPGGLAAAGRQPSIKPAASDGGKGNSPPSTAQRPSLSPFMVAEGAVPAKQATPSSKQKQQQQQQNTISRYFPQLAGEQPGVQPGAAAAPKRPADFSPPPGAPPSAAVQAMQQEVTGLR